MINGWVNKRTNEKIYSEGKRQQQLTLPSTCIAISSPRISALIDSNAVPPRLFAKVPIKANC